MQPDVLRQVQELQQRVAQLRHRAQGLAAAIPQKLDGADSTGCVQVVLGPDGLPVKIEVRDGWQRRIDPDRLGAAVREANDAAIRGAMHAWASALDAGRSPLTSGVGDGTPSDFAERPTLPQGQVRESAELAERVLASLDAAQRQPAAGPTASEGTDEGRNVAIQLDSGRLTGCVINPRWASHRDSTSINAALSAALLRAASGHAAATRSPGQTDDLVADALATLVSLTDQRVEGEDR